MRERSKPVPAAILALTLSLAVLTPSAIAAPAGPSSRPAPGRQESEPGLEIVAPQPGDTVPGPDVQVRLRATGVVLGGRSRTAAFVLLQIDDIPPVKSYADRFKFRGIAAGEHRLRVELRRADGSPFDPPVDAAVEFSVAPPS